MKKIIFFLSLLLSTPLLAQVTYWHETNGPEAGTVVTIMIDSSSPGRVIVLTAGSGAFRSTDFGNSWALLNTGLPKAQLYLGAVTPQGYIIAANSAADGLLFRYNENDPNAQWEEITPFKGTSTLIINDIICDPTGPIYLAAGSHGVLRSDDNGMTWSTGGALVDTTSTAPLLYDNNALVISIDGNGNLFAGLAANGAIFRSSDKGTTWKKLPMRCPDGLKTLTALLATSAGVTGGRPVHVHRTSAPHHLRLPLKYLSPRLAPNCSIHVVLADGANAGRLRPLVADRLRETHFLPRFQVVELVTFDAIAMKVDLPSIRRNNEPVVTFRMKRSNRSVRRGLVRFDVPLAPANEILKFAAGRIEGIVQRHLYILVTAGGRRIAADGDIGRVGNGQMQADAVGVALVMAMLRLADHDARRGDAVIELLKLARGLSHMRLD